MAGKKMGSGVKCDGCGDQMMKYRIIPGKGNFCSHCSKLTFLAKSTFPFTTSNISGQPVEVQSLRHLRQLEAAHGVQSFVYNFDRPETRERFES